MDQILPTVSSHCGVKKSVNPSFRGSQTIYMPLQSHTGCDTLCLACTTYFDKNNLVFNQWKEF